MKKKVLLLGGSGYIGGLTTDKLLEAGLHVTVYDNLLYEERYMKDVEFVYGDIRETEKIAKLSQSYHVIIMMAALVGDPACSVNEALTDEINFQAIRDLCGAIPRDKHVIFISTCSVYGAQEGVLNEQSPTYPLSAYAFTKLKAEKPVLERGGTIFRLGTVFGLGNHFSRVRLDLIVNVLTMHAVQKHSITIIGGSQWRPIISVTDVANYVVEATLYEYHGVFVIAKENVQLEQLGQRVANVLPNTKITHTEIASVDARNYQVNTYHAMDVFRYRPFVTVEQEVERMAQVFRENRIKNTELQMYNNGMFLRELSRNNKLK